MNCQEINQLNPVAVLGRMGIKSVGMQGNEILFKAPYRDDSKASLSFNIEKQVWVDFGTGKAGKLVDLLMLIYKVDTVSEMLSLFNKEFVSGSFSFSQPKEKPKSIQKTILKVISISEVHTGVLTKYLNHRGISPSSWKPFLKEMILENSVKRFSNLAFKNDSGGYEVRNPFMKNGICIGVKDITSISNSKSCVLVFEGFFDFLSFIEFGGFKDQSVIVLNSIVNTSKAGRKLAIEFSDPDQEIVLYLDNDEGGKSATKAIMDQFPNAVNKADRYKNHKDLNEYLKSKMKVRKNNGMTM